MQGTGALPSFFRFGRRRGGLNASKRTHPGFPSPKNAVKPDSVSKADPFEKFRTLLEAHYTFPCVYTHKFIGKNSTIFKTSVDEFEKKFIGLTRSTERLSASGKHLSLTYEYHAANADEVIALAVETQKINDLIYIL